MNAAVVAAMLAGVACGSDAIPPLQTAEPGIVYTYPVDDQLDVPLGSRIVVTFSEPVTASALGSCSASGGAFCLVGPDGPVDATAEVTGNGKSVQFASAKLAPGTTYALYVGAALAPFARNLPESGALLEFTTRSVRPRAAPPAVIAFNGTDPARLDEPGARPIFEPTTLRLVFSEPLDSRTISQAAGSIELIDTTTQVPVPATVFVDGIHVSIDPIDDLAAGTRYELRLGSRITDLGGTPLAATTLAFEVQNSLGETGPIAQVLRTRQPGDPGPADTRAGVQPNSIQIAKPLIGREELALLPSTLATELGDPKALDGPIAFTLRRGQRIGVTGLAVALGGEIPTGLATGDMQIELLTDAGGRIYRNPYQRTSQRPENALAPLYVDLSLDVAVFAVDPAGNAVLTQIALGVQATGTAIATEGVLAIETAAAMDLGLMGVTSAPTNFVLELITDETAALPADTTPPTLLATYPPEGSRELPIDGGIELVFDEPVDLDRLRAGGLRLEDGGGRAVAAAIEHHGAVIAIRPLARLANGTDYRVVLSDVADLAGNPLAATAPIAISTPRMASTDVPLTVTVSSPGAPCALTGGGAATGPGRCAGGLDSDARYRAFTLDAMRSIEVAFNAPLDPRTATRGAGCNTGSVRIEQLDTAGVCVAPVPGTLLARSRGLSFVPDRPWEVGARYRMVLVSGGNRSCDANELCGTNGNAASFDPLAGTEGGDAGGPNLVIDFTGAAPTETVPLLLEASPATDVNGSGFVESVEIRRDENRAALRITGTTGSVSSARFDMDDCLPATPETEGCMYLSGAMRAAMGELSHDCPLPDGTMAPSCIPVEISAHTIYATSLAMTASVGISIDTDTGTNVMRIREPADGPIMGYIIEGGGRAKMVVALDLYMDAPDMSLPLSSHDLHSKPMAVWLEGPVSFLPDGRISIALTNIEEMPVSVAIDAPLGIGGTVEMTVPAGEMKLQLASHALRGGPR